MAIKVTAEQANIDAIVRMIPVEQRGNETDPLKIMENFIESERKSPVKARPVKKTKPVRNDQKVR